MIKLVLTDMDNTLIPFGRSGASERTLAAIHACLDAGVAFGPATGRNRSEVAGFLCYDEAAYQTAVLVNGQQVYLQGKLVAEQTLDPAALRAAEELIRGRRGLALLVYRPDGTCDWVGDEPEHLGKFMVNAMHNGSQRHETLPAYPVVKAGLVALVEHEEELALQAELSAACPKVSQTHMEILKKLGALGSLPETSQINLFDF
jgi:hydroxymethylpyrimidine pyrophosphatase-like HAD family hydrolase